MFSKILIKLVDEAIVPAILLLVTRLISVFAIGYYLDIPVTINSSGFVYADHMSFLTINSYSVLAMVCVVGVGVTYVLIKSYLFHESHIHPSHAARLFSLKLSAFIQASFDLYSQGAIWLSYSYLLTVSTVVLVYFGFLFPWVFWVSILISLIATVLLVLDVEREITIKRNGDITYEAEEVVLTFEGIE